MYIVYHHDGSYENCEVIDILPGTWADSLQPHHQYDYILKRSNLITINWYRLNYYDLGPDFSIRNDEWKPKSYKKKT